MLIHKPKKNFHTVPKTSRSERRHLVSAAPAIYRCVDSLVSPELAEDVAEEEADGDHQHDRLRDQAESRLVQLRGVHLLADAGHKLAANLAPQTVCHARVQCGHF